jgi:nucleotide-binding universal stress UspA family protein
MYKRILVPVDGSNASLNGLKEAVGLAKATGARLRILHVVDGIAFVAEHGGFVSDTEVFRKSGEQMLAKIMPRVQQQVRADSVVVENVSGRASDTIIDMAKEWRADLIIMGTHGRRGVNRLVFGSDAELVIRTAPVPVMLVRSAEEPAAKKKGRMKKKAR